MPQRQAIRAPRIGLWDQYGGSMESGWTRWILEQFEFPFERVFAPQLDAGNLNATYDVLIFVNGGIPDAPGGGRGGRGGGAAPGRSRATFRRSTGRSSAASPRTARCRSCSRSSRAAAR